MRSGYPMPMGFPTNDFVMSQRQIELEVRKSIKLGEFWEAMLADAARNGVKPEEFFQKEGYQSKETAVVETKRGAGDPTYLYYTLGKLQIMKLRENLKQKEGSAFSLQKFHDDFLKQGFPPVKIVREAMLGDNSPTL